MCLFVYASIFRWLPLLPVDASTPGQQLSFTLPTRFSLLVERVTAGGSIIVATEDARYGVEATVTEVPDSERVAHACTWNACCMQHQMAHAADTAVFFGQILPHDEGFGLTVKATHRVRIIEKVSISIDESS